MGEISNIQINTSQVVVSTMEKTKRGKEDEEFQGLVGWDGVRWRELATILCKVFREGPSEKAA